MTKRERYIKNQEAIKAKAIYKLLQKQKGAFADLLEKEGKGYRLYTEKSIEDDLIDPFLDDVKKDIPEYLLSVLPKIMEEGAKDPIKRYKDLLPEDYALVFDVSTEPATIYLQELEDLMLSQRQGSILKTTRDELRTLIKNGIEEGNSYGAIAKQIREVDPWVFSKARAKTIATNEIGRSYGWANYEPGRVLDDEGYVLVKEWQTSHDDRVRPLHVANESAGKIDFKKDFPGTNDQFAPSTHDINCRCTSTHEIVGIQDGKTIHHIEMGTTGKEIKKLFEILKKRV